MRKWGNEKVRKRCISAFSHPDGFISLERRLFFTFAVLRIVGLGRSLVKYDQVKEN